MNRASALLFLAIALIYLDGCLYRESLKDRGKMQFLRTLNPLDFGAICAGDVFLQGVVDGDPETMKKAANEAEVDSKAFRIAFQHAADQGIAVEIPDGCWMVPLHFKKAGFYVP